MKSFIVKPEIRWSDLDPNFHLRHSVYYDWGALTRITFLNEHGVTPVVLFQQQFGPILFREECVFKREIKFGDNVEISLKISKSRRDMSRWTMIHEIIKDGETLSAILTVDGAWMHTGLRKLTAPPDIIHTAFEDLPKTADFSWSD